MRIHEGRAGIYKQASYDSDIHPDVPGSLETFPSFTRLRSNKNKQRSSDAAFLRRLRSSATSRRMRLRQILLLADKICPTCGVCDVPHPWRKGPTHSASTLFRSMFNVAPYRMSFESGQSYNFRDGPTPAYVYYYIKRLTRDSVTKLGPPAPICDSPNCN